LDPEARVYAGMATLIFIHQLTVVNGHPELLSETAAIRYTRGALHDIERGLAELDASDRAALRDWLEDTAVAVGGTVAEEVVGLLSIIELHGLQARIGDLRLAGPKLAETVDDAFALRFAADNQTFDFTGTVHLSKGQQIAREMLSGDFSVPLAPTTAEGPHQQEHGASLWSGVAGFSVPERHKHLLADDLVL